MPFPDAVGFTQFDVEQGSRVSAEPVEVVGANDEKVVMVLNQRFRLEAQRAAFGERDSRQVVW